MAKLMRRRLGDILLEECMLTEEQLKKALELQKKSDKRLGEILVEEGFVTEKDIIEVLEFQLGIPHVKLNKFFINPDIIQLLPEFLARKYCAFPIKKDGNFLMVALNDPLNVFAIDDIKMVTGLEIQVAIASKKEIEDAIDRYYSVKDSIKKAILDMKEEISTDENEKIIEELEEAERAPVVRLVNTLIQQAVKKGASDIHIEPQEKNIRIRYRVDGMLYDVMNSPKSLLPAITTRIKITAGMDITKKRLPQDGRIELNFDEHNVDIRVSTLPTVNGEKIVLRLLNRDSVLLDIEQLGFNSRQMDRFLEMLNYPYGMILVTGPTGSGKTTTLYSMLNLINRPTLNIITLEEPVEYSIPGVNQVQINPKGGITFANGLRSILRQDPNVIMVGEIRDSETADIAIRAALTGHLVFSTLHTNSASGAIVRLLDMGIEPYLLASCLVGVVAQRLVRKICPNCKQAYRADSRETAYLGVDNQNLDLYMGKGCSVCNQTGYRGRTVIGEIVKISQTHREFISQRATSQQIDKISRDYGYKSLKENGIELVKNGITTLDELMRVIYQE
jgi:type IV pilus assembly protein PilB